MYNSAERGEQVTGIYRFGIGYSNEILKHGIREVIEESGLRPAFRAELSKAVKLAKYVKLK
ncbi:hypothetical protein I5M27_02360 [Adhaeribacter sp. BT258]|uniref:HTH-like domain-containing protein n=2 Tax=Adhaeribacter terrigena TaxID=2793070 RepID=A0ABS1BZP0_9BACT|nr:hypothetical protein [Adhaeribacter terrigena]